MQTHLLFHDGTTYSTAGQSFVATQTSFTGGGIVTISQPLNNFIPLYEFGTSNLAPIQQNSGLASEALKQINIVPNPYYAFSSYEQNQLDNRIKIVNLPSKCTVTILTQNGSLIRKFNRDVPLDNSHGIIEDNATINQETAIDWDLKNFKGIPIASGIYLIHVDAGELGSRTLESF